MLYPPKFKPGDTVAILSLSGGLPEKFPWVFDQGLQRLQEVFHLHPVEYPTTRILQSSMEARAQDLHAALQNPEIKGIICSIGGEDQIKLLKYINPQIVRNNPKFFLGFSDNTHLELFFLHQGNFVSFYGPNLMGQFSMSAAMDDFTSDYLRKALFERAEVELTAALQYSQTNLDWAYPENLDVARPMLANVPWIWHNPKAQEITGQLWGGCLESVDYQLRVGKYLPEVTRLQDHILFLENSEGVNSPNYFKRVLTALGERGILQQFQACLVGRFRSQKTGELFNLEFHQKYADDCIRSYQEAFAEYNPQATVIFNVDFGHTDPIVVLPMGGNCRIDGGNKRVFVEY
jgi:muramoyltetrapeptide carboxypeptidase LdcA involved in peptidoglycan recycling